MQERQTGEANGKRVFQPVFVHGLKTRAPFVTSLSYAEISLILNANLRAHLGGTLSALSQGHSVVLATSN